MELDAAVPDAVAGELRDLLLAPLPPHTPAPAPRFRFRGSHRRAELEEVRAKAAAQLDLAFEVLQTLQLRGAAPDSSTYQSLVGACGRCGDPGRAQAVIALMHRDGMVTDSAIYSCLVMVFSMENSAAGPPPWNPALQGQDAGGGFENFRPLAGGRM